MALTFGDCGALMHGVQDRRHNKNANVVIFSPVGDMGQMEEFLAHMKKLGLDNDSGIDFLFLYRPDLEFHPTKMSAVHAHEKHPLGTSGCFFLGQAAAYGLGYDYIVITDLDALLDSKKTLYAMLEIAKRKKKAVVARTFFPENTTNQVAYDVNDWCVYPRQVFELVGFSTPYVWRGGDDYEFLERLRHHGSALEVYGLGGYTHPFVGFSIYHKLHESAKYYPYIGGVLKSILFVSKYDLMAAPKFVLWHVFYSFFADVTLDSGLKEVLGSCSRFRIIPKHGNPSSKWFTISKIREKGDFSNVSATRVFYIPASIIRLALFGEFDIYTDRVRLTISRSSFVIGVLRATALSPYRLLQAIVMLLGWDRESKKVIFPIKPDEAVKAMEIYRKFVTTRSL